MRVGIIGCGGIGRLHAHMLTACGLKLAVCADPIRAKAESLAQDFGAEATEDCMGTAVREGLDIVAVTTPTPVRTGYAVAAAQAGTHVFCEKPFGRNVGQCEEALKAAEKAGVKLFVAHVVRYFHEFEAMKAQIDAGAIGTPGFARLYRGGLFPMGEGGWFRDYAQSGGAVFDMGIHDIDWARYAFGDPERIFCQSMRLPGPINYDLTTMRMRSGMIIHFVASWAHPGGFRVMSEITGDNGMLTYDSNEAPLGIMMREITGAAPGMIVPGSPVAVSPYQREWEDFLAWIREGRTPRVTPQDAVWAVRMAEAALESAQTGQPVTFD